MFGEGGDGGRIMYLCCSVNVDKSHAWFQTGLGLDDKDRDGGWEISRRCDWVLSQVGR